MHLAKVVSEGIPSSNVGFQEAYLDRHSRAELSRTVN